MLSMQRNGCIKQSLTEAFYSRSRM